MDVQSKTGQGKQRVEPEFVDVDGLKDMFGIKRSLAYDLIKVGLVQSVCLKGGRNPEAKRGKRLFKVSSVRSYLNGLMVAQGNE